MLAKRLLFPAVRQVVWETFEIPDRPDPYTIVAEALCSLVNGDGTGHLHRHAYQFHIREPHLSDYPLSSGLCICGPRDGNGRQRFGTLPDAQIGPALLLMAAHGTAAAVDVRQRPPVILPDEVSDAQGALCAWPALC
ncbi:MAG: hypothetical protein R2911_00530 [Caldilineaceae bacterium]